MQAKILLIDDDELFRDTVKFVLEKDRHTVFAASDGEEGLRIAEDEQPNLVLCDVHMKNMHGYATVQLLKGKSGTARIPVIMMTGRASAYGERRSEMAGADYYLAKPFSIEELVTTVDRALSEHSKGWSNDVIDSFGLIVNMPKKRQ